MAKRVRYKIGDLFLMPLEDDLNGEGRVLNKSYDAILIELYKMKPIIDASKFDYNILFNEPLIVKWCYDDGLKQGLWPIFDSRSIDREIEMPYYWIQDSWDMKYYIRKGKSDSYEFDEERIGISEEDIDKYEPCSIGNEISERKRYIRRLREVGLL